MTQLICAEISEFQIECFERLGIARHEVRDHLRQKFLDQVSYNKEDDWPEMERLAAGIPAHEMHTWIREALDSTMLPYQCPHTAFLLRTWVGNFFENLSAGDRDLIVKSAEGSKHRPIVASAYTGELNATSLNAQDGSRGVVFEDELLNLFLVASIGIAGLVLHREGDRLYFDLSRVGDSITDRRKFDVSSEILCGTLDSMLIEGSIMKSKTRQPSLSVLEIELGNSITSGMFGFVYAHEWGHFALEHHELMQGTSERHVPRRTIPEQERAMALYQERYADKLPFPSRQQIHNFLTRQMMELEADLFAHRFVAADLAKLEEQQGEERLHTLCRLIGGMAVLPMFSMIEGSAVSIAYGATDYPLALTGEDDLVQNLCLRGSHPTPLNRIANIRSGLPHCAPPDDVAWQQISREYMTMYGAVFKLLYEAAGAWADTEAGTKNYGLGLDALHPKWRGLLRGMPLPRE